MIQPSKILTELYGTGKSVVGFRQPINPDYAILTTPITVSTSGVYLDGGLVTIENIKNCQGYDNISSANFNTLLGQYIQDAIIQACNLVFNFKDQIETGLLYNIESVASNTLENNTDFVGYEINVLKNEDISAIINSVICEFDAAGSLNLLLFHSSQQTALQTISVTLTEKNAVEKAVSTFLDKHKQFGGCYYIGYLTNGLVPKAINRNINYSYVPKKLKTIKFLPIKVTGHNSTSLFDISDIAYTSDTYGINFNVSGLHDFTQWVINNKNYFAELIKLQFQANILKMIINSNSNNGVEVNVRKSAVMELEGVLTDSNFVYSQGILRKLDIEAKNIREQFFKDSEATISNVV